MVVFGFFYLDFSLRTALSERTHLALTDTCMGKILSCCPGHLK